MTLFISVKIQVYVPLLLVEIIHAILYVSNSVSFVLKHPWRIL